MRQSTNNFYLYGLKMAETFLVIKTVLQYCKFHSRAPPTALIPISQSFLYVSNYRELIYFIVINYN